MKSYAALSDMDKVEEVLNEMVMMAFNFLWMGMVPV
jgi:pentatricopeptide repeat protein